MVCNDANRGRPGGQRALRLAMAFACLLAFAHAPADTELMITDGLSDYQVFQRGPDGAATLFFSATGFGGALEARVLVGDKPGPGLDWQVVARTVTETGRWSAVLSGVPTGGPYTIEVRHTGSAETVAVRGILVGDIWVLAGQSNMEGLGLLKDVEQPHPLVHSFGYNERWELAKEPLHIRTHALDPVHTNLTPEQRAAAIDRGSAGMTRGAGLGLPFAKMVAARAGVPIGLVPCAHGATSMAQWDPALKSQGGKSLYGSMLRRFQAVGGRVKGLLWYQGESDAINEEQAEFPVRWEAFVKAVREDFAVPDLPIIYAQLGRVTDNPEGMPPWDVVQEAQRHTLPGTYVAAAVDLSMVDGIHISTEGLKGLGRRMAKLALRAVYGQAGLDLGPRLESAAFTGGDREVIRVTYAHVNGLLSPQSGIKGFSLAGQDGSDLDIIASAKVDPESPGAVLLALSEPAPPGVRLWYGRGLNPTCNLVDAQDMAALAFGPVDLE
jgi:sialate O-acetylesterase